MGNEVFLKRMALLCVLVFHRHCDQTVLKGDRDYWKVGLRQGARANMRLAGKLNQADFGGL